MTGDQVVTAISAYCLAGRPVVNTADPSKRAIQKIDGSLDVFETIDPRNELLRALEVVHTWYGKAEKLREEEEVKARAKKAGIEIVKRPFRPEGPGLPLNN